ncbi:uncharacterized protein BDV17DRAFT_51795 [Aspergillus undulatus]|uniref:uncharacterized protein n=1 Tax=Aspergillus undulatus TaxID=1810928 RepID=UPI003CCD76B1
MTDTISQVLNQCLRDFATVTDSEALARYESEVSRRWWLDEIGRLRVWAGNIGAHQVGQSSLDYRLRDASHLKGETTKLLNRMLRVLRELVEVVNEDSEDDLEIDVEDDDEDASDTTEVQQLYQSIVGIINSLFQISMAIRKPADIDRLLNVKIKNESYFEPWAQQHVSHKYPAAETDTVSRLGKAMARQKAILKYRERHRAKLTKGLFEYTETDSTRLSETVATELKANDDELRFLETASSSGVSQTSYAPSLMAAQTAISIPNPPKESKDRTPFECPYCFHVITIKHTKDWARHVFRDLMPYVCLSQTCTTPSRLYDSRHLWFLHMQEAHPEFLMASTCPLCHADTQPPVAFERHVGRHLEELALFVLPSSDAGEDAGYENASQAASVIVGASDNSSLSSSPRQNDCHVCGGTFNNYDLVFHLIDAHPSDLNTDGVVYEVAGIGRCGKCGKIFNSKEQLEAHVLYVHADTPLEEDQNTNYSDKKDADPVMKDNANEHLHEGVQRAIADMKTRSKKGSPNLAPVQGEDAIDPLALHKVLSNVQSQEEKLSTARESQPGDNPIELSYSPAAGRLNVLSNLSSPKDTINTTTAESSTITIDYDGDGLSKRPLTRGIRRPSRSFRAEDSDTEKARDGQDWEHDSSKETQAKGQDDLMSVHEVDSGGSLLAATGYLYTNPSEQFREDTGYMDRQNSVLVERTTRPSWSESPKSRLTIERQPETNLKPPTASPNRTKTTDTQESSKGFAPSKGILKPPRETFPEDPNPIREAVAPLKKAPKEGIPPGARWTKIDRRLVNPAALEEGRERFEERPEYVIVLRVLTKEEIQAYATRTEEMRAARNDELEERRAPDSVLYNMRQDESKEIEQPASGRRPRYA